MSAIDSIIEFGKAYIGISEGSQEHKDIIDLYNSARYADAYRMTLDDPWCAAFIVALFQKADAAAIIPCYPNCDQMIGIFKRWNRWHGRIGYSPKRGDIIFYNWDSNGTSDHVGIVVHNRFGTLSVLEGNISDTVNYRNISCENASIMGYGTPNYDNVSGFVPSTPWDKLTYSDQQQIKSFPMLYNKSEGVYVKVLQLLLNYLDAAGLEMDGKFQEKTEAAVKKWQEKNSLEVDGVVGKHTWTSLLTQ